jgi:hypothetical protein
MWRCPVVASHKRPYSDVNLRIIEETKERKQVNSGRVYWLVLFFSMIEGPL